MDFRMTGETFNHLVQWLAPFFFLIKQDTFFRKAIPVHKRVTIGLWRLWQLEMHSEQLPKGLGGKVSGCFDNARVLYSLS